MITNQHYRHFNTQNPTLCTTVLQYSSATNLYINIHTRIELATADKKKKMKNKRHRARVLKQRQNKDCLLSRQPMITTLPYIRDLIIQHVLLSVEDCVVCDFKCTHFPFV